jgi:hypothetical protein
MRYQQKNRPIRLETLQARELMAVDLVGGELRITGTEASDNIEVSQEVILE